MFHRSYVKHFGVIAISKRPVNIVTIILVVLIICTVTAFVLPVEVEETVVLVSYQQEGSFDYIAYLKPFNLTDITLRESNPVFTQQYFTAITDRIEMTFSYVPTEVASSEVKVEIRAILESPDVWQKEITLVPVTASNGSFSSKFILDIDEVNQLFEDIDDEINISSSNRQVTIIASVLDDKEVVFIQRYLIQMGKTIIGMDSEATLAQSIGTGKFSYTVYLKENSPFDTEILIPPSATAPPETVRPGELLFEKLVDRIDMTFAYKFRSNDAITQIVEDVEIIAGFVSPDISEKAFATFVLAPTSSHSGDFSITFPIDMGQVDSMFRAIRQELGIKAVSYSLSISAQVHTVAQTEFGSINETFTHTMSTVLGESIINWSGDLVSTKDGFISTNQLITNKFLGLPVSNARVIFAVLSGIALALFLYLLVRYLNLRPGKLPEMELEALRVKKQYKDMIVDVKELPSAAVIDRIISLSSIDDLIMAAEDMGKVVLHKADKDKHTYFIIDAMIRYQYISKLAPSASPEGSGNVTFRL